MKLSISGYAIPSGNLVRQTLEAILLQFYVHAKNCKFISKLIETNFQPMIQVSWF